MTSLVYLLSIFLAAGIAAAQGMPTAAKAVKEPIAKAGPTPTKPSTLPAAEAQLAARHLQEQAVRKQAGQSGDNGFFALDWEPLLQSSDAADCDPLLPAEAQALLDKTAKGSGLDPPLLRAVVEQESGWRPCAQSPKGATGLMQLMPEVAGRFQVDASDPEQNLKAGAGYLKELLARYNGDVSLALAAYNAGPGRVDATGKDPKDRRIPDIEETKAYVAAILAKIKTTSATTSSGTSGPP